MKLCTVDADITRIFRVRDQCYGMNSGKAFVVCYTYTLHLRYP